MKDDQVQALSEQITQLSEGLSAQIQKADKQLSEQMLKLYQHTEERFNALDNKMQVVDQRVTKVYDAIDGLAKRLETNEHERAAMNYQLDRHQRWHEQVAGKLGITLDYQQEN